MLLDKRFLLYIDILGFEKMAQGNQHMVRALFDIVDELNAHDHEVFQTLIFSDTILTFNRAAVFLDEHKEYVVMFLIEFAADIFYRLCGTGITFRAVLVEDQFECQQMQNMTRFFGRALIRAYRAEKGRAIIGLLADSRLRQWNKVFQFAPFTDELDYIFINQNMRSLEEGMYGTLPVTDADIWETDAIWHLAKDYVFLKHLRRLSRRADPGVKEKATNTIDLYRDTFPGLIGALERGNWRADAWRNGNEWAKVISRIPEGFRGWGDDVPSESAIRYTMRKAMVLGKRAARQLESALKTARPSGWWYPCGGALLYLNVDPKSPVGQALVAASPGLAGGWTCEAEGSELHLHLAGVSVSQAMKVCVAGEMRVLAVIEEDLGIKGRVERYVT